MLANLATLSLLAASAVSAVHIPRHRNHTSSLAPRGPSGKASWYTISESDPNFACEGRGDSPKRYTNENAHIVAIMWPNLLSNENYSLCGKTIIIQYEGKTTTAQVVDGCPTCDGNHQIDLSPGAFKALEPDWIGKGVIAVNWCFADGTPGGTGCEGDVGGGGEQQQPEEPETTTTKTTETWTPPAETSTWTPPPEPSTTSTWSAPPPSSTSSSTEEIPSSSFIPSSSLAPSSSSMSNMSSMSSMSLHPSLSVSANASISAHPTALRNATASNHTVILAAASATGTHQPTAVVTAMAIDSVHAEGNLAQLNQLFSQLGRVLFAALP